jgi:L-threonylcarbamoyladenylate synthase
MRNKIVKANIKNIKKAARLINKGGVVAFPTETVYGLGADAFNAKAVAKIFEIKERPRFDPLITHICEKKQLYLLTKNINEKLKKLIEIFWPGPLTIIVEKKESVPDIVSAGLKTVAIRMPANEIALKLIKISNTPIAAPSANKFSRLSPTRAEHVYSQLKNKPDLILDGGKTIYGLESTIVKFENGKFYLLRAGAISPQEIKEKTGIRLIKNSSEKISAPGQLKKHYSPKARLFIVKNENEAKEKNAAYLAFYKKPKKKYKLVKILSAKKDLSEAASNLFDFLHSIENKNIKCIYIEKVPNKNIGIAINDRIERAAASGEEK